MNNSNYLEKIQGWARAYPEFSVLADFKSQPHDFCVSEQWSFEPQGEGEHLWLWVSKQRLHTDAVAKALARHFKVAYRDVSYAGLKDFHAVTEQWFSVWLPKQNQADWQSFELTGAQILKADWHTKKIRRGAHAGNFFVIRLRNIQTINDSVKQNLKQRLEQIRTHGVPNYFGEQRFGNHASNLDKVTEMFVSEKAKMPRSMRSILLSSARSFLFNQVLSERIKKQNWTQLHLGEPACLNGSNSFFNADGSDQELQRLAEFDIHPSAPLWGRYNYSQIELYQNYFDWESSLLRNFKQLQDGLEKAGLKLERRATRCAVNDLSWQFAGDDLVLEFSLWCGQYATSVLRELITINNHKGE